MNIEAVRTEDGIGLKGLFLESNNVDQVCLFIPGCCGNFIDNDFIRIIGLELVKQNYNVLCANTRGSFMMNRSFHPQNLERPKEIGAAYEFFEECIYDIDAWIKHLVKKGYKKINIICHSSGCNKFIYYMNCNVKYKEYVNNIVFLSPPDFANRIRCYEDYEDLVQEATKNIQLGEANKLIKVHFFYKTSISFISMMKSKNFDNLPLVNGEHCDFEQYNNIENPISIIYGSQENYIKNYIDKLVIYANPNTNVEYYEIPDADHIYYGKEEIVGKQIADTLNKHSKLNSKKLKKTK